MTLSKYIMILADNGIYSISEYPYDIITKRFIYILLADAKRSCSEEEFSTGRYLSLVSLVQYITDIT